MIPILLILIPAMPLLAAAVIAALGPRWLGERSHWPAVAAVAVSCVASVLLVFAVQREPGHERIVPLWTWATVEAAGPAAAGAARDLTIDVVLRADPLTAVMLATVTFVSLLVVVYSVGYMHGDPGYWRFFACVSLFVFSMTMLVSVSNFVMLYVFWEAVGLCSYLLIGFWYQKREAAAAGMKAFLVNRVGDFGFALGIFLLWTTYGTLNFHDADGVMGILGQQRLGAPGMYVGGGVATAICLLLLLGACGKSAQFPLHVWLPDAMEGPTPVSALIHAATMVTAGVYMVARCTPLFAASPEARQVVAVVGGVTALMAAVIALTQTDLKRILAYSTISQLGFMFLGLGTGTLLGVAGGMFHLVTHALFKALLFLGAGSVMHAMGGVVDLRQFGGLRRRMPTTYWTFLVGCLALAGVAPLAGFWSKDAILAALAEQATAGDADGLFGILYPLAMLTAFLTAVYTFRAFFLAFYGEERVPKEAGHHAHESPPAMTGPLVILALGAIVAGAYFQLTGDFLGQEGFLAGTRSLAPLIEAQQEHDGGHLMVALLSTAASVAGIAVAAVLCLRQESLMQSIVSLFAGLGLTALSRGRFFVDEIYQLLVVAPLAALAAALAWIDQHVIDAAVNAVGAAPRVVGAALRPLQGGLVPFYALVMVLGLLAMIGALLL